jgi:hypothetical protein
MHRPRFSSSWRRLIGTKTALAVQAGRSKHWLKIGAPGDEPSRVMEAMQPKRRGDPRQVMLAQADNGQARSVLAGAPARLTPDLELDQVSART